MLFSRVKREKKGNEQPMVECDGNVINWCENEKCEVKCGDGTEVSCWLAGVVYADIMPILQVKLTCADNSISVITINGKSKVYCGPDAPQGWWLHCQDIRDGGY